MAEFSWFYMGKMKRRTIILILILAIFFVSILQIAAGEGRNLNRSTRVNEAQVNDIKKELAKEREFAEIKREKLQKTPGLDEGTLEKFRILEKEKLETLMKLNKEKLSKLALLQDTQIAKLAEIKISNLRKIAGLDEKIIRKITKLGGKQLEKLSNLDRARLKRLSELDKDNLNRELRKIEIRKTDPKLLFKKRIISKQKVRKAEERFQIARQRLVELKKELDSEMKLLKTAEEKNDDEAVKEHAKKYLLRAADAIINHLEKIKSKIQQSESLNEDDALELIKDINLKIDELEDAKSSAEDAAKKEEIRKLAKTINAAWKRIRIKSEFYVSILSSKKIREIIQRSEQLEKKLEGILTELEAKNLDTAEIEKKLTAFSEKIDEARTKFHYSMEKFEKARATGIKEDLQRLIIEAKSSSKEARTALKEAHNILTGIIKDIRSLDKTVNFEEEREEEQIIIEEKSEKRKVNVEIEGFLKPAEQELIDSLIKSFNQTKTHADIEIRVKIEDQRLQLKKEVTGTLTESQKYLINKLTNSLEDTEEKVKIKISAEVSE
jgi:hypothetical protein